MLLGWLRLARATFQGNWTFPMQFTWRSKSQWMSPQSFPLIINLAGLFLRKQTFWRCHVEMDMMIECGMGNGPVEPVQFQYLDDERCENMHHACVSRRQRLNGQYFFSFVFMLFACWSDRFHCLLLIKLTSTNGKESGKHSLSFIIEGSKWNRFVLFGDFKTGFFWFGGTL